MKIMNTKAREHDHRCSGILFISGWHYASLMTCGTRNIRFGA